jgi:hypothetical protein
MLVYMLSLSLIACLQLIFVISSNVSTSLVSHHFLCICIAISLIASYLFALLVSYPVLPPLLSMIIILSDFSIFYYPSSFLMSYHFLSLTFSHLFHHLPYLLSTLISLAIYLYLDSILICYHISWCAFFISYYILFLIYYRFSQFHNLYLLSIFVFFYAVSCVAS